MIVAFNRKRFIKNTGDKEFNETLSHTRGRLRQIN